jgi:RNA polymerase sigma-70 factor (ECF subfamily)
MDVEIVMMAQGGDQAAFATLATAANGRLHRVAQNILGDLQLAEDATQAAMLEVWRSLPRLRDPERFEAWSCRILVNACYAEIRRSKRWIAGMDPEAELDPDADQALTGVMYRDQLERGFRRVPVDQRAVLVLHHYLDMTLEEVARVLGIPEGTAHSRLSRAMSALRAALEADARIPGTGGSLENVR